jgi:hypothetical protein
MRKRRMDSLITVLLPVADREIIEREADARGVSLAAVVRDFMNEGMKARGLSS